MNRRRLLGLFGAGSLLGSLTRAHAAPAAADMAAIQAMQKNWRSFVANGADIPTDNRPLKVADADWKKRLVPAAYDVLRREGTEYPFTSPLNNEKRAGLFVCAGCGLPLFTSEMKFDSGTGWPSFFTTIPGAFATKKDYKMIVPRTEYHCTRCGGHHGHVFDDGPPPTNERWCNNGVALRFIPKTGKT